MRFSDIRGKLMKGRYPTPLGWVVFGTIAVSYTLITHAVKAKRAAESAAKGKTVFDTDFQNKDSQSRQQFTRSADESANLPGSNLPQSSISTPAPAATPTTLPRQYNQPSFGNLNTSNRILSDDFLPKGTILYATLTSDIVSNNQVSPATATIIHPAIIAHRMLIPVGTQITGKIAPGNLRGRVFVNWDTLVFYEEGRQGWELPIRGIGMTYEQNEHSGRWIINGAGLKGYLYDDSTATAFKLAALRAMQDFAKTMQTYITTQASAVTAGSVVTTTTTTPEATLQNSGLGAASAFFDILAQRYAASLQQQNSYVLVPTARMVAIFLDEPIDVSTAGPGRSMQQAQK
jgi:phage protein U